MPHPLTPAQAWSELVAGNQRFVEGQMIHPSQGIEDRHGLRTEQHPFAVIFGCSDSRVASELIFDRGLGDLFVVRTAGHVVDTTVLGSIEYGVDLLSTPLVIVLGHAGCGAVAGAAEALRSGDMPRGFVRAVIDRVIPSIVHIPDPAEDSDDAHPLSLTPEQLGREHVRHTVRMLMSYSAGLAEAVDEGRCAVVGLQYDLADGQIHLIEVAGQIDAEPEPGV